MRIWLNTLQLGVIAIWGITCYCICRNDAGFQYFMFWIIAGFPFGFRKLRMILVPKGFGLAGELGVFALDAIVAGLIGGIFLVKKIITILEDLTGLRRNVREEQENKKHT